MRSLLEADLWDFGKFELREVNTPFKIISVLSEAEMDFRLAVIPGSPYSPGLFSYTYTAHGPDGVPFWHKDFYNRDVFIVSWASEHPTELAKQVYTDRWETASQCPVNDWYEVAANAFAKTIHTLEAQHLYLIHNTKWFHRTPYFTGERHFVRMYVEQGSVA